MLNNSFSVNFHPDGASRPADHEEETSIVPTSGIWFVSPSLCAKRFIQDDTAAHTVMKPEIVVRSKQKGMTSLVLTAVPMAVSGWRWLVAVDTVVAWLAVGY